MDAVLVVLAVPVAVIGMALLVMQALSPMLTARANRRIDELLAAVPGGAEAFHAQLAPLMPQMRRLRRPFAVGTVFAAVLMFALSSTALGAAADRVDVVTVSGAISLVALAAAALCYRWHCSRVYQLAAELGIDVTRGEGRDGPAWGEFRPLEPPPEA